MVMVILVDTYPVPNVGPVNVNMILCVQYAIPDYHFFFINKILPKNGWGLISPTGCLRMARWFTRRVRGETVKTCTFDGVSSYRPMRGRAWKSILRNLLPRPPRRCAQTTLLASGCGSSVCFGLCRSLAGARTPCAGASKFTLLDPLRLRQKICDISPLNGPEDLQHHPHVWSAGQ